MTIDLDALRKLLCERLCEEVRVERRPNGALMLRTRFRFPDGDSFPIHLSKAPAGGLRLSDRGHTLMHLIPIQVRDHSLWQLWVGTGAMADSRCMIQAMRFGVAANHPQALLSR